jgi:hypothetical protein
MARPIWIIVAGVGLLAFTAGGWLDQGTIQAGENPRKAPKGATKDEIKKLIAQLEAQDPKARTAAAKRLTEIGEPALAALREAARDGSAEVRRQARKTVREIEKRVKGSTKPAGVALDLQLAAKKRSYVLDLGGKTETEFRDLVKELSANDAKKPYEPKLVADKFPAPPKVDLKLELRNSGKNPIHFIFGRRTIQYRNPAETDDLIVFGRGTFVGLEVQGPGALTVANSKVAGPHADAEGYRSIALGPGKSFSWSFKELRFGPYYYNFPRHRNIAYWTRPGEYTVRAVFKTAVGQGKGGRTPVTVYSNWVKIKVVEKKAPAKPDGSKK